MAATTEAGARHRRPALVAAVILLLSAVGWYAGPAEAVTATTTVDLTNDSGTALFDGSRPLGTTTPQTACLTVSGSGAADGDTVSIAAVEVAGPLADHLRLTVDIGSGGGGGSCTGFTGTRVWSGTLTDLANATGDGIDTGWHPAATATRSFRISAVIASGSSVAGGTSASGKFAWRLVPGAVPPPPTPTPTTTSTTAPTTAPTTTRTTVPTTAAPTRTTEVEPTQTPTPSVVTQPHTVIVTGTEAPPAATPTPTPTAYPSGVLDTSLPTTPAAPTPTGDDNGPTPTGSLKPGGGGSGSGSGSGGTTGTGGAGGADVVLGAVTKVKAVPAAVGNALGSLVSSSLSPLLGGDSAEKAGQTVAAVIASPQYPLVVIVLAIVFLLVQYRIDARDPKLAKARVSQRDDELQFPDLFGVRAALGRLTMASRRDAVPPTGTLSSLSESAPPAAGPPRRWVPWRR